MSERREKSGIASWLAVAAAGIVLASAVYLGAYVLMVRKFQVVSSFAMWTGARYEFCGWYLDAPIWSTLFEPANRLDRFLWPDRWPHESYP